VVSDRVAGREASWGGGEGLQAKRKREEGGDGIGHFLENTL